MALAGIMGTKPYGDVAKIDATTEAHIVRHKREEGYDPEDDVKEEDIVSPARIAGIFGRRCLFPSPNPTTTCPMVLGDLSLAAYPIQC
jgi:hypothetical protein